jgi:hypothetical protein
VLTLLQSLAAGARGWHDSKGGMCEAERLTRRITGAIVCKWRERFRVNRLEGLLYEPRPGAPRSITDAQVEEVVTNTLEEHPADGSEDGSVADRHCSDLAGFRVAASSGSRTLSSLRGCLKSPGRSRLTVRGPGFAPAVWKLEWETKSVKYDRIGTFQTPSKSFPAQSFFN